ncbi:MULTISPECIES: hypothetical protein [unclassified Streptomyces]|uniref:hypothetical protein n=1 Tax=unclassified Streptomyces TaxID=2593676 RepID=UPI0027415322|nr:MULTISPECIES: hypothetical protein [unclassified Streptomyces]
MAQTPHDAVSETLASLLADRTRRERNKELARALVADAYHAPVCESVLAEGDRVTVRVTLTTDRVPCGLIAEFRFDAAGDVAEYHDFLIREGALAPSRAAA